MLFKNQDKRTKLRLRIAGLELSRYQGLMRFRVTKEHLLSLWRWAINFLSSLWLQDLRNGNTSKLVSCLEKRRIIPIPQSWNNTCNHPAQALGMTEPSFSHWYVLAGHTGKRNSAALSDSSPHEFPSWAPKPCYSLPASHFLLHNSSSNERTH